MEARISSFVGSRFQPEIVRVDAAAVAVMAQAERAGKITAVRGIHIQVAAVFIGNGKSLFHTITRFQTIFSVFHGYPGQLLRRKPLPPGQHRRDIRQIPGVVSLSPIGYGER